MEKSCWNLSKPKEESLNSGLKVKSVIIKATKQNYKNNGLNRFPEHLLCLSLVVQTDNLNYLTLSIEPKSTEKHL